MGNFGELTAKAVETFQQYNGLAADGKIGQKTFELLYSSDVKPYFLKYGAQSGKLKTYQKRLNSLGYLTTEPDGKYGTDTVAAVKRFQEINGLIADGFLGPGTVRLLMSGSAHANALVLGMKGNDVQNVQNLLKALGYISHVTGYFGSETEDGVKAFQKRNGLSADGTVGKQTMTKLNSRSAKKAASGGSGSSGSGASGRRFAAALFRRRGRVHLRGREQAGRQIRAGRKGAQYVRLLRLCVLLPQPGGRQAGVPHRRRLGGLRQVPEDHRHQQPGARRHPRLRRP